MKEKILKLRENGKTYTEIQNILGCSRGTISYHCGVGQKDKSKVRQDKNKRSIKSILFRKIDLFLNRNFENKLSYSKRGDVHNQMYNKIINNPYCYITGDVIDLSDSKSYCLDHIIPFYLSEDNSVENLGLSTKDANASKAHLLYEDYVSLCKKVIKNYEKTLS